MKLLSFFLILGVIFGPIGWLYWLILSPEKAIAFLLWAAVYVYVAGLILLAAFVLFCLFVILKNCLA